MEYDTEYNTLREEILSLQNRELGIATFSLTAVAAIIGFGFTEQAQGAPYIFLAALVPLSLALLQFSSALYSKITIATYIRCTIEPNHPELQWEQVSFRLRKKLRKAKKFNPIRSFSAVTYTYMTIGMGGICLGLTVLHALLLSRPQQTTYSSMLVYIMVGVTSFVWYQFSRRIVEQVRFVESGKYEDEISEMLKSLVGEPSETPCNNK